MPLHRHPLLGLAISAVALGGVGLWAIQQPAPRVPTSAGAISLLAASVAVYACSMGLRGFRWSVILRRAGIRTKRIEPYVLTLVGYMGNAVLPVRGGEVLRVVLLKETSNARWWQAVGSIIPERVLDAAVLVLLFGAATFAGVIDLAGGRLAAIIAATGLLAFFLLGAIYLRLRAAGHFEALADRIRPVARASRPLFSPLGAALGVVTVGIWLLDGVVFWLVGDALGIPLSIPEAVALAVFVSLVSIIPAGPAYAGTFDAATVIGLQAYGIAGGVALAYTLMVRLVIFVPVTAVGLVLVVTRYGGLSRLLPRRAPGGPDRLAVGGEADA